MSHSHSLLSVYFRAIQINTFTCLFLHNLCISPLVPWTSYHGFDEIAEDLLLGSISNKHCKHCPSLILQGALVHSKPIFANQNRDDIKLELVQVKDSVWKNSPKICVSCMARNTVMWGCMQLPYWGNKDKFSTSLQWFFTSYYLLSLTAVSLDCDTISWIRRRKSLWETTGEGKASDYLIFLSLNLNHYCFCKFKCCFYIEFEL